MGYYVMHDPQRQLLKELSWPGITQKSIALTYAFVMRQDGNRADYAQLNSAISKRWPKGLERVKSMAWKFMENK